MEIGDCGWFWDVDRGRREVGWDMTGFWEGVGVGCVVWRGMEFGWLGGCGVEGFGCFDTLLLVGLMNSEEVSPSFFYRSRYYGVRERDKAMVILH